MIIVRRILRGALASMVATTLLLALSAVGQASAAEPWWHITTVSAPPSEPGGEGRLLVEASNLGDAMVDGVAHPVTVVDRLPAGVSVTHVYAEAGGGANARALSRHGAAATCASTAKKVTCTYRMPLWTYERLIVAIDVQVTPEAGDGENEVSVSGGGAAEASFQRALTLGSPPSPYGVDTYEVTPEEEGGAPDTQAGSHPFQLTTTLVLNTQRVPIAPGFAEVWPVALAKDLRFNLPAGLIGNPAAVPQCSARLFAESGRNPKVACPNNTAVGVATTISTSTFGFGLPGGRPLAASWGLFNLEPAVGEPARFGFQTVAGPVILDTSVRTGGDYGIVVTVPNITEAVAFFGSQVTFWGNPSDPRHDTSRGEPRGGGCL
ncbi:MAG TPA: hypothetical protein VNY52_04545, partial [Solirubrobacteraceae bacterium]|nr:hypothetical protein [Solirubrobacteraceae bacterium]